MGKVGKVVRYAMLGTYSIAFGICDVGVQCRILD